MSDKWARRYRRHRRTHVEYFTALAEELAEHGQITLPIGDDVVRMRIRYVDAPRAYQGRWLETSAPDGRRMGASRVDDREGSAYVEVLTDALMRRAALIPGLTLPRDTAPHDLPETWRERRDRHDQEMLRTLGPAEQVRALGACGDITDGGTPDSGQKLARVLVTDRRIIWGWFGHPALRSEVWFDSVTSFSELSSTTGRYGIQLQHAPIQRLRHVPTELVVDDASGARYEVRTCNETRLAFSRRETRAAVSIRAELERRQDLA
jgi:hypothetical protein